MTEDVGGVNKYLFDKWSRFFMAFTLWTQSITDIRQLSVSHAYQSALVFGE